MKQEEKSLRTKEKVLKAAMALFAEKGYQASTMSDIVKKANLSKGAVYHQFTSKETILHQIMTIEAAKISDYLEQLAADKEASAQQRLAILTNFLVYRDSLQDLSRINWAEQVPFGLLFTLRNTVQNLSVYAGEIIKQGNQQGEFTCHYPMETASVLLLLVDVWLDPLIGGKDFAEVCHKIDYITYFLKISGLSFLSDGEWQRLKEEVKPFYE